MKKRLTTHPAVSRSAARLFALWLTLCILLGLAGCGAPAQTPVGSLPDSTAPISYSDYGSWLDPTVLLEDTPIAPPTSGTPASSSFDTGSSSAPAPSQNSSVSPPSTPPAAQSGQLLWHYERLGELDKQAYADVYAIFMDQTDSRDITPLPTKARLKEVVAAVTYDHPEIFWYSGEYAYSFLDDGAGAMTKITLKPTYNMDATQRADYQTQLEALRDSLFAQMAADLPAGVADYHKALYIYEWLANHCTYVDGAPLNQTLVSSLLLRQSVCAGYAKAYQYLLNAAGIPCTYLAGNSKGERHGWNLAQLDGEWYYMDPTWGDSDNDVQDLAGQTLQVINYEYFAMTLQQLLVTHDPDIDDIPATNATAAQYPVRENLLFDSWDPTTTQLLLTEAAKDGKPILDLYFTGKAAYDEALASLKRHEFHDLYYKAAETQPALQTGTLRYFSNEDRWVLSLVLQYA